MILLKCICIILVLLFLYYRSGILCKKIIKSEDTSLSTTLLFGFIFIFAIFEIINMPFALWLKNATIILYDVFLGMHILIIILSYAIQLKEKKYNFYNNFSIPYKNVFFILSVVLITFQIINSTLLFKEDADDSFYISWANEAKSLENFYDTDPSMGIEGSTFDKGYIFNVWEIYGGFLARTFQVNVTTLFHSAYHLLYIVLAYLANGLVLKKLVKKEQLWLATFLLAVVFFIYRWLYPSKRIIFTRKNLSRKRHFLKYYHVHSVCFFTR